MVPLLLLIRTASRRALCSLPIILGLAWSASTLHAQTFATNILTTTYIDSWVINQTNNYGHAHTVKVVIDGMGQGDPTKDGTICRGLFQLPPQVWTYPADQIVSAKVAFYVWQDYTADRNVTVCPLTRSFVQGTGAGTYPPDGATWFTYDGVNPWTSPGADFDTNFTSIAVKGPVLSDMNDRFFTWDITTLLQNPASRAEIKNYGAMLRIDETPVPASGMPRAPFTTAYDPSYTPAYWPTVQLYIRPAVLNFAISNRVLSFTITNLTVGATNSVERSFTLASNSWSAVSSFIATGIATNWSDSIQPTWTNAFYRVHTQF